MTGWHKRLVAVAAAALVVAGCSAPRSHPRQAPSTTASTPPSPSRSPSPTRSVADAVQVWVTTASGDHPLAAQQPVPFTRGGTGSELPITVDDTHRFQQFWGVGGSITGASAQLISQLPAAARDHALAMLFSRSDGIGLSVLRQPLGANDFSIGNATYDNPPAGNQDPALSHFSLGADQNLVLPLVRQAHQLNSAATAVLTPWSAPAWMKTSGSVIGGTLDPRAYVSYASYLSRAIQEYAAAGMPIAGVSVQNEPSFSPGGYAGMQLSGDQQARLIGALSTALRAGGQSSVGIWALDDNYDRIADAQRLVDDPAVSSAIAGVAFHCYRGDTSQLAAFHARNPKLPLAISECSGGDWSPRFADNLRYDAQNLLIDGIRNGASWVAKWNVALDPHGGPTNGGCTTCQGLVTIDPVSHTITPTEAYYAFGHLGKFVTPGAQVLASTTYGNHGVDTVAFRNPDGSHVLFAYNASGRDRAVRVSTGPRSFGYNLPDGAAATFIY